MENYIINLTFTEDENFLNFRVTIKTVENIEIKSYSSYLEANELVNLKNFILRTEQNMREEICLFGLCLENYDGIFKFNNGTPLVVNNYLITNLYTIYNTYQKFFNNL